MREGQYSIGIQAVLARIVWEFINTGKCEKTVALLAKESGTSERTVQMAVRRSGRWPDRRPGPSSANLIGSRSSTGNGSVDQHMDSRRAAQEDNYGVSFKGAKSCTLRMTIVPNDSCHRSESCVLSQAATRRMGFSRSLPCDPAALSSRIDRRPTNRFEEHLAELERSVLAQAASTVTCDGTALWMPRNCMASFRLNGDRLFSRASRPTQHSKRTNGSSD